MNGRLRRAAPVMELIAAVGAAAMLVLALSASPASAFDEWQHDGTAGCVCHSQGTPTDATCIACHSGMASYPGKTCWSCHAPGQDTSALSSSSAACSQSCHLYDPIEKAYVTPTTHGTKPHRGSSSACLNCHPVGDNGSDPKANPHHSGQAKGIGQCGACHLSPRKHAGRVACTSCHTTAQRYHRYQASSPGFKNCRSCHAMRHAGRTVAASKCVVCHKGGSGRPPQHSTSITKTYSCGGCHGQRLHASALRKQVKSCRTCHAGKFHARQSRPPRSTCTRCHGRALRHADGFQCTLCHRPAVHAARPNVLP